MYGLRRRIKAALSAGDGCEENRADAVMPIARETAIAVFTGLSGSSDGLDSAQDAVERLTLSRISES